MMVGHCHPHPHRQHPHHLYRSESSTSRDDQYSSSGSSNSSANNSSSVNGSSEYSLALPSESGDRARHLDTVSLLDSIERRTQRTYRYGIGLVCVGATLNWLGFAQGSNSIDPLRYLGVACVLTGSFCVCLAMCRWLGRPISVSGHHVTNLEDERSNGDVHVINVPVPLYVPSFQDDYRPTKPPDYEQIVAGEPPPYDEAIKLSPGAFFGPSVTPGVGGRTLDGHFYAPHFTPPASCQASPSHNTAASDLTRALLLEASTDHRQHNTGNSDHVHTEENSHTPNISLFRHNNDVGGDPPPAYEPSPRPSISSLAPLIPTSSSRFDLPPSFSVRRLFGGVAPSSHSSPSSSPHMTPRRRPTGDHLVNINENLPETCNINEDSVIQNNYVAIPSMEFNNNSSNPSEDNVTVYNV